ncbi:DUF4351 domain-containing protein [Desulfoscipio gibsoniae]
MNPLEYWLTFMKNAHKSDGKDLLQKLMGRKEELAMAMDMLEEISADERLRQKAYAREKARLDAISRIKCAELKGMEKGKVEGKADLLIKQLSKRFGNRLPKDLQTLLMGADDAVLDTIGEEIFDLQTPDDILKFLN